MAHQTVYADEAPANSYVRVKINDVELVDAGSGTVTLGIQVPVVPVNWSTTIEALIAAGFSEPIALMLIDEFSAATKHRALAEFLATNMKERK